LKWFTPRPHRPETQTTGPAYVGGTRVKISVSLPDGLLEQIDRLDGNRSAFLERAARQYLSQAAKAKRDKLDAEIIERHTKRLNEAAMDVLGYQGLPE
jgi:metal-responsive CopG/Arc/MetJ family transcriptional regulator